MDVRFSREILGHAKLETPQINMHVSIRKLKEIHAATHPGARLKRPAARAGSGVPIEDAAELRFYLAAEAAEEDGE